MPEIKSTFSIVKNLLKVIVLAAVAGGAIFGNFVLEKKMDVNAVVNVADLTAFDYGKENLLSDRGVIRFADEQEYVGTPSMDVITVNNNEYILKFNKGKIWGNFGASNAKVNILVGNNVVMIPNRAIFTAEFDGESLKVMTLGGDLYFGFLEAGVKIEKYVDKNSSVFMNRFVVPRGAQAVIADSKIDQRFKTLLYSRLYTEFKRSTITDESKKVKFIVENREKDNLYFENLKNEFEKDERFDGGAVAKGNLADAVFWAEENLTFIPEKKNQMMFNHLFAYLDQSIYYANKDNQISSDELWVKFNDYRKLLPDEIEFSKEYYSKINSYIDELEIFSPGDAQYDLYKKLLDQKFDEGKDKLDITDRFWSNVYEAMDKSSGMIKDSFSDYYDCLEDIMAENSAIKNNEKDLYKVFIAYQDQLIENLFLRYENFYQFIYFEIKETLENEILSFHEQGQLRTELSQDFISRKIDFLRRLKDLFFNNLVDVDEAEEISRILTKGIYYLSPAESAKVAVSALFQSQLDDMTDFWGYLDDVEYNGSKAHGLTHSDRYKAYLEERNTVWTFDTMIDDVLGGSGTVAAGTIDKIKGEITLELTKNKDVVNLQVADIHDAKARYIEVKYVLGGYPVKAIFDRDSKSLKDVFVYEQAISEELVKPDDLLKLIDEKLSSRYKIEPVGTGNFEDSVKKNAERIAKLYLIGKIKAAGFEVTEGQIALVDETALIYRVEKVFLKDIKDTIVTFDYLSTQEKVSNLYFELKGTPIVLAGEYTLEELNALISNGEVEKKGEVKKTQRGGI
jgi:hypothetical protein